VVVVAAAALLLLIFEAMRLKLLLCQACVENTRKER